MATSDGSSAFVSSSGTIAHPDSPAGGGGPGAFRPGTGSSSPSLPVPSRTSPAGRSLEWQGALFENARSEAARRYAEDAPLSGWVSAAGLGSILRIPVPGSGGLAIELSPRGWTPKGGTTSSLFIQDLTGKRTLRLDLGFNKQTRIVEWHWNQKGTHDVFGIGNHTSARPAEQALGVGARYFKYAGRALVVAGVAADLYSIVTASRPLRRSLQVVSAWATASAGCESVGAGGAWLGTAVTPGFGTAVGGILGCAIGGFIGYATAEAAAGYLYDWAEGTIFTKIQPENSQATQGNAK